MQVLKVENVRSLSCLPVLFPREQMPKFRPGILTIVLGVAFFAVGTAISFGFRDLDLRFLEFQLVLVFYLLTSVLAFSGLSLTILGVGRVLRGQGAI